MNRQDIDDILKTICPNDEDFEKACISPAYLKKELEALALEPTETMIPISVIEDIKAEIEDLDVNDLGKMGIITAIIHIIDKHISGKEKE